MRKIHSQRQSFVFVLLLSCAASIGCRAQPPIVSWEVLNPRTTLHEPVYLRLTVRNLNNKVATLDLGGNFEAGLQINVIDPKGEVVPTPVKQEEGFQAGGEIQIAPGMVYTRNYVVNEWYEFDSPGRYVIGVRLLRPILVGEQRFDPPLESNQEVLIGPKDEAALRKTCESLFATLSVTNDAGVMIDGFKAFRTIHDPIAVPYLIRLSTIPFPSDNAIAALGRFTTPDAIETLLRLAKGSGRNAELAKRTVLQMAREVEDPRLLRSASGSGPDAERAKQMILRMPKRVEDPALRDHIYESLGEPKPR